MILLTCRMDGRLSLMGRRVQIGRLVQGDGGLGDDGLGKTSV